MPNLLLSANGIVKNYRKRTVLSGVNFTLNRGEVVAIVGENGSGKSTFLKICAGVLTPDEGTVKRNGRVGYCPQDPGLLPNLTIDEHLVCFGTGLGLSPEKAIKRGRKHLKMLGTKDHEGLAAQLSGGTRQKLNLALALLGNPDILLLDEPYQGFDHGTYVNFWDLVQGWKNEGRAVVVITHLLAELSLADRVVDLSRGRAERVTDSNPNPLLPVTARRATDPPGATIDPGAYSIERAKRQARIAARETVRSESLRTVTKESTQRGEDRP
jgi:ABC-2 type transport system ATP-binding protein